MKLARTIRFDPSDLNVFPVAAEEGEWALVGTFCFADVTPEGVTILAEAIIMPDTPDAD